MDWLIPLIVIVLVALALVGVVLRKRVRRPDAYPYSKKHGLFSPAERSFLGVLEQAIAPEYRVFGKVRVADVVEPRRGLDPSARQRAVNRTWAKHVDFLLCEPTDLSVVCVIELDDRSHDARRRQERDAFLAGLCAEISLGATMVNSGSVRPLTEQAAVVAEPAAPACPKCSGTMVRRQARTGANAGEPFWGCSRFPTCRGTLPWRA